MFPLIFNLHEYFKSYKGGFLSSLVLFKSREFADSRPVAFQPSSKILHFFLHYLLPTKAVVNVDVQASLGERLGRILLSLLSSIQNQCVGKICVRTKRARSLLLERSLPTLALPAQRDEWGLSESSGWIPLGVPGWVTQFANASSLLLSRFSLHALQPDHKCSKTN